ncbi:hypothetical protein D3C74_267130 [compost metagenome]
MRSDRSTVRTWERRRSFAAAASSSWRAARRRARSTRMACSRFWSWDFSFCIETVIPVGRCVMRTAESVVLTDCPPGPEDRYTSMRSSFWSISISPASSTSGNTSTPAAEVWMRPCDSVTGTRWTRCTPPSYLRLAHTPSAGSVAPARALTATWTSL